jgi:hypothetical protein
MDTGTILARLYPDADPLTDYTAAGNQIVHWDDAKLGPRPTEEELRDAWLPALKAQRVAYVRRRAVEESEKTMPVYELIYLIRNRISDARLTTLDEIAKKGRDLEAAIGAATSEAEIEAALKNAGW